MSTIDQSPTFNMKAVTQETGLKADTLRAWERRYGMPQPDRTLGGHRLYSQQDIDTLKWLVARQEEGLSISRAVALWRELEADGQDPLTAPGYSILESVPTPAFIPQGDAIAKLRDAWISACKAFDERAAEQVIDQAFAAHTPETVCFELLQKGLAEIGAGWYRGEVTVQQEHFTSELSVRRLEALVAAAPPPTRPGRILVGCAPEDAHTFAPLLLTFLLKRRGWDVVYLGARVPAARLEATVDAIDPHLVILTAQQLYSAATLLDAARLLQQQQIDVPLAYGGLIFNQVPDLRDRIPGHFLGERLELAPQATEHLLTTPRPVPVVEPPPESHTRALAHFRERQMFIEASVWQNVDPTDLPPVYLTLANEELARNIAAALKLGNIYFLSTDIDWIQGLLENYPSTSGKMLRRYLAVYHQAAQTHLDERGQVIIDWLAQLNGTN